MDALGIDRRKIERGVLLNGFDKQSEIDVRMDEIDILFDSDRSIKWARIVQNGGRQLSEQGESFGTMQLGEYLALCRCWKW